MARRRAAFEAARRFAEDLALEHEIVSEAKKRGADVIVMGSRGRGDLAGLVLGSTAHKVIHLADRQVMVVR